MQPYLHTCSIKVKCGTIICVKETSSKVRPLLNRAHILGAEHSIRMIGYSIVETRTAITIVVHLLLSRYLSIRWGIDLSKMVVFVGEKGDTDYEDLLAGLHKTLILRGAIMYGSEDLLHGEDTFKREDVVPQDSPNIPYIEGSYEAQDISAALKALEIK